MKKIYYFAVSGLLFCMSCTQHDDPLIVASEMLSFSKSGNDQKAFAGDFLADSIEVTINNLLNYSGVSGMVVHFTITSGYGELETDSVITDLRGKASTRWKLGNNPYTQTLKAFLYLPDGSYRGTLNFSATGFMRNGWSTATNLPDRGIRDMAADSISGNTFAVINSSLYRQGSRMFDWIDISGNQSISPFDIMLGNDRKFYMATYDGRVFKNSNQGEIWQECNRPFPPPNYGIELQITSDLYLWTTCSSRGLRCSRDHGETWSTDSIGLVNGDRLRNIYKLTDGSYFLQTQNNFLYRSDDGGHSWTRVATPDFSRDLYVTDQDELILFSDLNGTSIFSSVNKGETFTMKKNVPVTFYTTATHHNVLRWGNDYFVLIPGHGILKTTDFESFNNFWTNGEVMDMMMDSHGNLIVTTLNQNLVYYYHNPDNAFE
jgi:hypothetical protein